MDSLLERFLKFVADFAARKDKAINAIQAQCEGYQAEAEALRSENAELIAKLEGLDEAFTSAVETYTPDEATVADASENNPDNPTQAVDEVIEFVGEQPETATDTSTLETVGSTEETPAEVADAAIEDLGSTIEAELVSDTGTATPVGGGTDLEQMG